MAAKLYVGNLSFEVNEDGLKETFAEHGEVVSVRIITDRDTGRSRGFGFVEYETKEQAQAAIDALNDQEKFGRQLKVNFAKEPTDRGGRGGGGGGFRGGRGGGRGRY